MRPDRRGPVIRCSVLGHWMDTDDPSYSPDALMASLVRESQVAPVITVGSGKLLCSQDHGVNGIHD